MAKKDIKTTKNVVPMIYAYTTPEIARHDGWTKIGYTENDVDKRLNEQTHTADVKYKEEWRGKAEFDDGSGETFTDHDFHRHLVSKNIERNPNTEWFKIEPTPAKQEFYEFRSRSEVLKEEENTVIPYTLRTEQEEAVQKTLDYMYSHEGGEFLWNAKPRFGKTLAVYDLVKKMGAEKVLVVTNRPAIANSWYSDYTKFARDYLSFVTQTNSLREKSQYRYTYEPSSRLIKGRPFLEFESLQDLKGSVYLGGKIEKFRHIVNIKWDLLVIDEAHEGVDTFKTDVAFDHIQRAFTLHLSGTPFKALANAKFDEDAIFNWTYADEQKAKEEWNKNNNDPTEVNPYEQLPQLSLFTYQMSEIVKDEIKQGIDINGETEEYAFDLNEFFATDANDKRFVHERAVSLFLDALTKNNKYPFSTPELRNELKHTVWLLDRVASVNALAKKLEAHPVFKDYKVVIAAGDGSLDNERTERDAYREVKKAIANNDKTITLTVGQLTTGVTIPEWTAVLMLSNVGSPSLYMQAAFRAQNPCLFHEGSKCYRKERAYVFDFDPARTLIIYEQFANDLISKTSSGKGSSEERKENIKTLLNFFPVIGEDEQGEMVELDAAKVLSIPRKIKSTEVVKRGFLSNFLFQNISKIFAVPKAVTEILNKLPEMEEGKMFDRKVEIGNNASTELSLNDEGNVELSGDFVKQTTEELFGNKIYQVNDVFNQVEEDYLVSEDENEQKSAIEQVKELLVNKVKDDLINTASEKYGKDFTTSEQNRVERVVKSDINYKIDKAQANYQIETEKIAKDLEEALVDSSKTSEEIKEIKRNAEEKKAEAKTNFINEIKNVAEETTKQTATSITTKVETHKRNVEKQGIEEDIRGHLRGFSRTIPSFLMAYGTRETTLANLDSIIPAEVFKDVTSITIKEFKFLRDGGNYTDPETKETKYYEGHLFDEVVFNDSIQEFLNKKKALANYFDESNEQDIFDYIPPQESNRIFTPKKVVKEMVDLLEEENPGCFDDDSKTFADLYMKSGLYIAEIVKRLYNSEKMKEKHPDDKERLNHIFAKQVYGLAPAEIFYRICLSFILGFSDDIEIKEHNIKLCDTLPYAKKGTLENKLLEIYPQLKNQ